MMKQTTMRRHPVLIPISREHHQVLLLAQLLKKDAPPYRGLPESVEGKIEYAADFFKEMLARHLQSDHQVLFPFLAKFDQLLPLCEALQEQNQQLQLAFTSINNDTSEAGLDTLGHRLEQYVRTKERQLFQQSQSVLSEADFARLAESLPDHG